MFDIITVGSATVDAFAQTESKSVKFVKNKLCYPGGAKILMNKLKFTTGGGGTNTAVAFSRLGLKTAYLGKMGTYANAWRVLQDLKQNNVNTSLICRSRGRTGYSIILDAKGEDRTILAFKGSNNDLGDNDVQLSKLKTKWFYFSAMLEKSFDTQVKIAKYAKKKGIKIAYNPSSYLAKRGARYLKPIISKTSILILNKEETKLVLDKRTNDISKLAKGLLALGPELVVITYGKHGSYACDGTYLYFLRPTRVKIAETTGAGDAFASGFVAGIIKGKSIETSLKMGAANAESVIRYFGAKEELLSYRKIAARIKTMHNVVKKKL
jgi:ribokinase